MKTIVVSGRTTDQITLDTVNTKNGPVSRAKFTIANDDDRRGQNRDDKSKVDFFDVTAWGKLADTLAKYVSKGRKILVIGTPKVERYVTKEGQNRRHFDIKASRVEFMETMKPAEALPENTPEAVNIDDLPDDFDALRDDITAPVDAPASVLA